LSDGRAGKFKVADESGNETYKEYEGVQLFHASELQVVPKFWDAQSETIKAGMVFDNEKRFTFNTAVAERKKLIHAVYLKHGVELTSDTLEVEIDKVRNPEKYEVEPDTFLTFVSKWIADADKRRDPKTGRLYSADTTQQYRYAEKHLRDFAASQGKVDFGFDEIDKNFYDGFVSYLQVKRNMKANSVGKYVKSLKTLLKEAREQGYHNSESFRSFKVYKEETDNVYLDENELQTLKNVDLSGVPYLDKARDLVIIQSWTGVRHSDLGKITTANLKGDFFVFRQQKTNDEVNIPLHCVVKEIIEKYGGNLPTVPVRQRYNEYIRSAALAAGFTSKETLTRTVGGKLVSDDFEKWQCVSSHTARRSFCTNMYKRGLPTLMIMAVSGHRSESSFLQYIKVKQSEHAEMMKKEWEIVSSISKCNFQGFN
jgi:integrase